MAGATFAMLVSMTSVVSAPRAAGATALLLVASLPFTTIMALLPIDGREGRISPREERRFDTFSMAGVLLFFGGLIGYISRLDDRLPMLLIVTICVAGGFAFKWFAPIVRRQRNEVDGNDGASDSALSPEAIRRAALEVGPVLPE